MVIDGQNAAGLSTNARARIRRRVIGFVFQDFNLLPGLTALENVALALEAVVLVLLTISVAGAAFGVATTYNIAGSNDATFGRAQHFLRYDGADPAQLADRLARTKQWYGTVEEIGHRYASCSWSTSPGVASFLSASRSPDPATVRCRASS